MIFQNSVINAGQSLANVLVVLLFILVLVLLAQPAATWFLFPSETWRHYGFASKHRVVMSTFLLCIFLTDYCILFIMVVIKIIVYHRQFSDGLFFYLRIIHRL